jgi:hypothetical protein
MYRWRYSCSVIWWRLHFIGGRENPDTLYKIFNGGIRIKMLFNIFDREEIKKHNGRYLQQFGWFCWHSHTQLVRYRNHYVVYLHVTLLKWENYLGLVNIHVQMYLGSIRSPETNIYLLGLIKDNLGEKWQRNYLKVVKIQMYLGSIRSPETSIISLRPY